MDRGDPRDTAPDGFSLIEVVVALMLLAIVATAALQLFVRAMASTDLAAQRQQAVGLAGAEIEKARALPAGSLVLGRTESEVDALWADPGAVDTSQSVKLYDEDATVATSDTLPISQTVTLNHVDYTIRTFVNRCYEVSDSSSCGTTVTSRPMIRVSVGVTWEPGGNQRCTTADGVCGYVAATLVDPSSDPTFNNS